MKDKVTILILVDRRVEWQKEKAKLMFQSFINMDDVIKYIETKDDIYIETDTHFIRIVGLTQSPRGYRANFIIDLSDLPDAKETSIIKSTYDWTFSKDNLDKQLKDNGWIEEKNESINIKI